MAPFYRCRSLDPFGCIFVGGRSHRVLGFRSRLHCVVLPLGFRRVIGFDPALRCRTLALSKVSVSSLWQRVRNRVPPTVSNPVPRARAAFWITDDRVSIPMGFEPAWVSIPRVRTRLLGSIRWGSNPRGFRSLGFEPDSWVSIPMGLEPDSWVSIPRVLGFEPDSWVARGSIPDYSVIQITALSVKGCGADGVAG